MSFIDYPFSHDRPTIIIEIKNPVNQITCKFIALIDTGADCCVFPASMARLLEIDLRNSSEIGSTLGIENKKQSTYGHRCIVSLLSPQDRRSVLKVMPETLIKFSDKEFPPLLGTRDFLRYFTLTVRYSAQITRLIF